MTNWYFDIETEGDEPQKHKVLSIQYQELRDGEPAGPFQILAEWEWGEKQIVRRALETGVLDLTSDFVPVGMRSRFDLAFLMERAERHGLKRWSVEETLTFWRKKRMVDLGPLSSGVNGGDAQIPSPDATAAARDIPHLYLSGQFGAIVERVTKERDATLARLRTVRSVLDKIVNSP